MNAIGETFIVNTDASGNLANWNIYVYGPTLYDGISVYGGPSDFAPGDTASYGPGVDANSESSGV